MPPDFLIHALPDRLEVWAVPHGPGAVKSFAAATEALDWALARVREAGGGCVDLGTGRFVLDRTVELPSMVRLCGRGPATVIEGAAGFAGEALVAASNCGGIEVRDVCLCGGPEGPTIGLVLDRCDVATVSGLHAVRFAGFGLVLRNDCLMCDVGGSVFAGNGDAGITVQEQFKGNPSGDFPPNRIHDCRFLRGGAGVRLRRAVLTDLTGCTFYQTGGPAIDAAGTSNSTQITGCRTFQCGGDALRVEGSQELIVTGNTFCWHEGAGIRLRDVVWGTVCGNAVIDSGSWNPGGADQSHTFAEVADRIVRHDAIILEAVKGVTVSGNAIFSWNVAPTPDHGICEDEACADNLVANNIVNPAARDGISARGHRTLVGPNGVVAGHELLSGRTQRPGDPIQSFQPELLDALIARLYPATPHPETTIP